MSPSEVLFANAPGLRNEKGRDTGAFPGDWQVQAFPVATLTETENNWPPDQQNDLVASCSLAKILLLAGSRGKGEKCFGRVCTETGKGSFKRSLASLLIFSLDNLV